MFKSVKALLCILLLVGLFAVLIMCESDAHKIAKSKELIKQHAKIAAAQKMPWPQIKRIIRCMGPAHSLHVWAGCHCWNVIRV